MEVTLLIEDQTFKVKKDVLCQFSDYFRAMFSGSYVENEQEQVKIDVVDANSMKIVIKYMNDGFIDLREHSLSTIYDLALAANFLQITELLKQIEHCLELDLSYSNWLEVKRIAEISSIPTLEKCAVTFGLLYFDHMKSNCIPSIPKLYWYLAHPYLNTRSEMKVFKFGLEYIQEANASAEALLIILGCLDLKAVSTKDYLEIQNLIKKDYENSLAAAILDCLHEISSKGIEMSPETITEDPNKQMLIEKFTERVYNEVVSLISESRSRCLKFTPCVCAWLSKVPIPERGPHSLYTFTEEKGYEKWLEVADKNLWGWSIAAWGPHRLVVTGGEYGRGTGNFNKDVAVYDTLKKEWIKHGVQLPPHRHAGVVVHDNQLYIVGGAGAFRVILSSTIVYDLVDRSFRNKPNLPDNIQTPAICVHNDQVYVATQTIVYQQDDEAIDGWNIVMHMNIRANFMVSLDGYIYITQSYFGHLFRFRPGVDAELEMFTYFSNPVAAICDVGGYIIAFTQTACGQIDEVCVEEFKDDKVRVLKMERNGPYRYNDVAGSCALVMSTPPIDAPASQYPAQYVARFKELATEDV